jgi:hypothetical protein
MNLKESSSVQKKSFASNWSFTKKYWLILFLVGSVCLAFCQNVQASSFSPTVIDIAVMPGQTAEYRITIENTDSKTTHYQVDPIGIVLGENGQDMQFADLSEEVRAWFTFSEVALDLLPGETREVGVYIAPHSNIKHQSLTVGMLVTEQFEQGSDIHVSEGFVSLVFLTIGDDILQEVSILDYSVSNQFSNALPISFFVTLKNDGEQIVQPVGAIHIKSMFGKEVAMLEINPKMNRVAHEQTRSFSAVWSDRSTILPPLGVFRAVFSVEPWNDGEVLEKEIRVVVISLPALFFWIVGIIILIKTLLRVKRRR